jgi:hypothetical protein
MAAHLARGLAAPRQIINSPRRSLCGIGKRPRASPQPPVSPPPPSADAFDANGELVELAAIQDRTEYENAVARYSDYRDRYETALNSETSARDFFRRILSQESNEAEAVTFLEAAHNALAAYGDVNLTDRFRQLINRFIVVFSLRYEVREPFSLHTTIPGVFSKLISEIKKISEADDHLRNLYSEFEEAFSDLKSNRTQARIKTCLQKQFNLLEALGRASPNVTETTLGAICNQLDLPHTTIRDVGKKLYGFGSNYPGIRHSGDASGVIRQLNMTDFVSISLMLASFAPYVTYGLDSDLCYTA